MSKQLLSGFARDDPERFAKLLGNSSDPKEAIEILADIPDGLESDLVSRLSPDIARRLLSELPDAIIIGWLSSCSADSARNILTRIDHERSASLVSGITDRLKRVGLQRLIRYPQGTTGNLASINVMTIRDSLPVSEIAESIQRQESGPEAPIVIVRDDGKVCGVLDVIEFLKNRDPHAHAADFCVKVRPVHADASQTSLINREEWKRLGSLPVVNHKGQLIGYISRSQSEEIEESVSADVGFLSSIVEVSRQFFEAMAYLLTMIFTRRSQG